MTENNDRDRLAKGPDHIVDRRLDELAGVVSHIQCQPRRQGILDAVEFVADALNDGQRIAGRRGLNADEDGVLEVHGHVGVIALSVERDRRDIPKPDEPAVACLHDHFTESVDATISDAIAR